MDRVRDLVAAGGVSVGWHRTGTASPESPLITTSCKVLRLTVAMRPGGGMEICGPFPDAP